VYIRVVLKCLVINYLAKTFLSLIYTSVNNNYIIYYLPVVLNSFLNYNVKKNMQPLTFVLLTHNILNLLIKNNQLYCIGNYLITYYI